MADVFISYSRQDQAFVRALFGALEVAGQDTWVDWEDIPLTTDWWAEIREGIEEAKAFVFVMTPASLASQVCTLEVALALTLHKRIIPVLPNPFDHEAAIERLTSRPVDSLLKAIIADRNFGQMAGQNWQTLSAINWVQFADRDFDTVTRQLLDVLETDYDHAKTHTRLLQRALEWDRANHPTTLLLRGDAQREAEGWVRYNADKIPKPTDIHREYIASGIRFRLLEYRRLQSTVAGLIILLILAIGAGILAVNRSQLAEQESLARATQQRIAEDNAANAEASLRAQWGLQSLFLAGQSRQVLRDSGDTTIAIDLALEAFSHYDEGIFRRESQLALSQTLNHPLQLVNELLDITNVIAVDSSADGTRYLVATQDSAYVWTPEDEADLVQHLTDSPPAHPISEVSFTSEDKQAVVVTTDRTLLLTLDGSADPITVQADQRYERIVASESGAWVWASRMNGDSTFSIAAWAVDGSSYHTLPDIPMLQDAYFSPDNRYLAIPLSGDQTLLWDIQTDTTLYLKGASYKPMVWAGNDVVLVRDIQGTMRVFRVGDEQPEQLFFIGRVINAVPSPDGTRIAVINADETLRVLRTADGQLQAEMVLFEASASAIVWNAAQTYLMTWGREGILLWKIEDEFPQSISFLGGAFGLFTDTHALVAGDRSISVIALEGTEAETVAYPIYPIVEMGWNQVSQRLMVRAGTSPLRLWTAGNPPQPRILTPDEAGILAAPLPCHPQILGDAYQTTGTKMTACSADTNYVAGVVSEEGVTKIWALNISDTPIAEFNTPYPIRSMHFSPDGTRLAVVDADFGRPHIYTVGRRAPLDIDVYVEGDTLRWRDDGKAVRLIRPYSTQTEEWLVDVPSLLELGQASTLRPLTERERADFYLLDDSADEDGMGR